MKHIYLVAAAVVIIGTFVLYVVPSDTNTYVRDITNEITALEAELELLDSETNFEELTPEQAVEKQAVIVEKLARIQSLIDAAPKNSLSRAKYEELQKSLQRLADSLGDYRDSLLQLDTIATSASPATQQRVLGRGRSGINSVVHKAIGDTIQTVNEHLEIVGDDPIEEEIADLVEEVLETLDDTIEEIEEESGDADASEETIDEDEMADDSDDGVSMEMPADDSEVDEMVVENQ